MSIRSVVFGSALAAVACFTIPPAMAQENSNEPIEVVFEPTTPEHGLHAIQDRMKAAGITLTYTDVKYAQGKLVYLGFDVKTPTGHGSATGDIVDGKRFGFRSDTRQGSKVAFIVGTLPDAGLEIPGSK